MPHIFSPIDEQIAAYFPSDEHPYRILENRIEAKLTADAHLLDIGCGRTAPNLSAYESRVGKAYGIDVVEFEHPGGNMKLLNESITDMHSIPSDSIDLAYSRSVMEHIAEADEAFEEIYRVLKPGASYIFLTANKYDYASLVARIVPNKFHPMVVKFSEGREEFDTFPTTYKANSLKDIKRLAEEHGFEIASFSRLTQYPNYFRFNRCLFWIASQYERMIRNFSIADALRGWILCEVTKR